MGKYAVATARREGPGLPGDRRWAELAGWDLQPEDQAVLSGRAGMVHVLDRATEDRRDHHLGGRRDPDPAAFRPGVHERRMDWYRPAGRQESWSPDRA